MTARPSPPQPAFPSHGKVTWEEGEYYEHIPGMTLRDYFAGQALIGLMSDPGLRPSRLDEFAHMAERLYQVADALLAERAK
jgi:hypothetical protein